MSKPLYSLSLWSMIIILFAACAKKKAEQILVYPNPATTYIVFDATKTADKHKHGEVIIKNTIGDVIQLFRTNDSSLIHWSIDTVQRGVYFYTYKADKMKTQTGRIQFN
ncbi:MAG: T9SS type A sorting domain-containing protein [Flavipsychrobacter sp.]